MNEPGTADPAPDWQEERAACTALWAQRETRPLLNNQVHHIPALNG